MSSDKYDLQLSEEELKNLTEDKRFQLLMNKITEVAVKEAIIEPKKVGNEKCKHNKKIKNCKNCKLAIKKAKIGFLSS